MMYSSLDYHWEIELRHKRWDRIIQPFTSLSITHLIPLAYSALSLQLWDTSRPVCYEGRADSDMIISLLMAVGKINHTSDWLIKAPITKNLSRRAQSMDHFKGSEKLLWPPHFDFSCTVITQSLTAECREEMCVTNLINLICVFLS